jgi:hypothetical protein
MAIHFGRQVYNVIPVAALQTANDSSPLETAPLLMQRALRASRARPLMLKSFCRCAQNFRREQASEPAAEHPLSMSFFDHMDDRQRNAAFQRHLQPLHGDVTACLE